MQIFDLGSDVLVFVGKQYESVSTAFLHQGRALLVDTLAAREDAERMRDILCNDLGQDVAAIICTHYMDDHMAGLQFHPNAVVIAHRYHRHTFLTQAERDEETFIVPISAA